jgi:hypothetical protein
MGSRRPPGRDARPGAAGRSPGAAGRSPATAGRGAGGAVAAAVPPAGPPVNDVLAQLTQLGELRTAGVLTDAEFEAQKARILNG